MDLESRLRLAGDVPAVEEFLSSTAGRLHHRDQDPDGLGRRRGERAQRGKCGDGGKGGGDQPTVTPQLVARGTQPTAGRRESREHAPTLGRTGVLPLGLSTGESAAGCQPQVSAAGSTADAASPIARSTR